MNIVIAQEGELGHLRDRLTQAFPTADVSVTTSTAATLEQLEQRRIDWLVVDSADAGLSTDYLTTVHDRAPDCSVLLLATEPLDSLVAPVTLEVTIVRPASDDPDSRSDLADRVVDAIRRRTGDSQAPLDSLFEAHALPMLLIDPETGAIIDANRAAVAFYGYTIAELTAMSIDDINTLDPAEVADRRRQAADSPGKQFIFEHRTKSGDLRMVEVNSTSIQYGDRTVLFSIIQDITARTEAEHHLHSARNHYQRLAEQNVVGVYVIEDEVFTYVNPKMAEIFGTTPAAMIGTSVFEYVAATDRDRVRSRLAARETGDQDSVHYTFAGERTDGEPLVLEAHGGRVETPDGVQIIGTLLDITEREAQESELRRLSQALEYAAPAVYITNADSIIEYVNPAFERITGYTEAEALGETPAIINSGRMSDDYYRRLYRTLQRGEVWEESIIDRRKNGELYYAYQTIAPYLDEDGVVEGYVAIQSDVTDERINHQVIEVYQRILRHNLRNKLNIIRGHTELMEPAVLETPLEEHVEAIDRAAATLAELSEKAYIARHVLEVDDETPASNLVEVLAREQDVLGDQYPDATLVLEAPDELWVYGAGRVEVCVREVLENAIIHNDTSAPRVEAELRVDETESMAELVIRDTGPGLTDLDRKPIELGGETSLLHAEGIGLWVVNWVMTSLGGEVEFADNDPRGLVVTLRFPYVDDAAE
ncbi:PAS domain-containing sensor histidine kinase [Haloglomus litoreum]|uniref:PAS domain-containing sensor histidine kinase n=1 Tax=Haloglomus litoreum TaxID=3034026 RepID=UPI0023E7746B|nr:PAS domain S-box protein [Haloglomus sp. DT116]